jgi:succinate dehydrogenase subunit C
VSQTKKYPELPRKKMGPGWWLGNRHYTVYMMRELTSFFVAAYSILYIYQVALLANSPGGYANFLSILKNPLMIGFSVIILGFTLFHAATWFFLIGRVQPLKFGKWTSSPVQALIINTVLLVVISGAIIGIFFMGK